MRRHDSIFYALKSKNNILSSIFNRMFSNHFMGIAVTLGIFGGNDLYIKNSPSHHKKETLMGNL